MGHLHPVLLLVGMTLGRGLERKRWLATCPDAIYGLNIQEGRKKVRDSCNQILTWNEQVF